MKTSKKLLALIATLAFAVGFVGCGKSSRSGGSKTDSGSGAQEETSSKSSRSSKKSSAAKTGEDAENEAIEFHNSLMGLIGAANKPLEKLAKATDEAVSTAQRGANPDGQQWRMALISDSNFPKIPGYNLTAPESFSSSDQEFFNNGIKTIRDSVREILKITGDLESYYSAEDFKDDWYKKLYMSAHRLNDLYVTIDKASDPLAERINGITEEIDNRNVAQIPVGKYVLNMRAFSKKYREMTSYLLDENLKDTSYGAGVTAEMRAKRVAAAKDNADKADALCKELDELAASQRTLKIDDYVGSSYEKLYQEFYTKYDGTKGDTRRIIRQLRENGGYADQYIIERGRSDLGHVSGEFADRWNEKGSKGK